MTDILLYYFLGTNANPTLCLDNESNLNNGQIVSIVRTSTSLLIESLIQQLCILFEDDSVRRNKLYFGNIFIFFITTNFYIFLLV